MSSFRDRQGIWLTVQKTFASKVDQNWRLAKSALFGEFQSKKKIVIKMSLVSYIINVAKEEEGGWAESAQGFDQFIRFARGRRWVGDSMLLGLLLIFLYLTDITCHITYLIFDITYLHNMWSEIMNFYVNILFLCALRDISWN